MNTLTRIPMAMSTKDRPEADGLHATPALLRLLQLVSPGLPIGAFAYSHGLEWAVAAGWIGTEAQAEAWIGGLLRHVWARLDAPVLGRLLEAFVRGDDAAVVAWGDLLHSSRESAELQAEDRMMGQALARLLEDLGVSGAGRWAAHPRCSVPVPWACAAVEWHVPRDAAAAGLLWTYAEHQVAAAVKLVPLGQTAGQRMLAALGTLIPAAVQDGWHLSDDEIGSTAPALGIAGALHETQYTRLFRS
jgi:urease accessory protein